MAGVLKYFTASRGSNPLRPGVNLTPTGTGSSSSLPSSSRKGKEVALPDFDLTSLPPSVESVQSEPDVVILCATEAAIVKEEIKKRKRSYELNRRFQDKWAAKYSWAESVLDANGVVRNVRCIVCTTVEGREKLLVNKADSLRKHTGRKIAQSTMNIGGKRVIAGESYVSPDNVHVKNERLYTARGLPTIAQVVKRVDIRERNKKPCQFVTMFHIMSQGRPMEDYSSIINLLTQLEHPDLPKKHWSHSAGWEIAEALSRQVVLKLKELVASSRYISVTCDEVTSVDNCSWISLHIYIVKNFARVPMLLGLVKIVDGCTAENLQKVIVETLETIGGLKTTSIAEKLISFGADGAPVFQGSRTGVIARLQQSSAPYMMGFHCVAHRTQLAAVALAKLVVVQKIEDLCQSLYVYFSNSPKRRLEFQRLADCLETEGLAILRNVKTRWISVLAPITRILGEYKTLVVNMSNDAPTVTAARNNANLLLDLQTLLAIPCLLPLLHSINSLIKFAQARNVFICDFVTAVKVCQAELFEMYIDTSTSFTATHFGQFLDLVDDKSIVVNHEWLTDLETHQEFLAYRIQNSKYPCHLVDVETGQKKPVGHMEFVAAVTQVRRDCADAAQLLIDHLDKQFPDVDLINALGIVFPQYWLQEDSQEHFSTHYAILKAAFCTPKSVTHGSGQESQTTVSPEPLSEQLLDLQQSLFKITMLSNSAKAMMDPVTENPLTKLWNTISANRFLSEKVSEWIKLAEIAIVTVIGSVEDERTFSTLAWMKNKIRNKLGPHLDCTIRVYSQNFFTLGTFPYATAIADWENDRERRGVSF